MACRSAGVPQAVDRLPIRDHGVDVGVCVGQDQPGKDLRHVAAAPRERQERGVGPLGDEKTVMLALLDPVLEGGAFLPLLDQTGCDLKVDSQLGLRAWRGEEPFVVIAHPHALPRIGRDGSLDFIHVSSPFMEPAFR